MTRRGLMAAGASGLMFPRVAVGIQKPKKGARPKNVILMVAGGMSVGALALADRYLQATSKRSSAWRDLLANPDAAAGVHEPRSADSLVADSAAVASAWSTGRMVANGALNTLPDGTALSPLLARLADRKMRRGIVTTAAICDGVPAAFAVSHPRADDGAAVAAKLLGADVELILGGGDRFVAADRRADRRDLYAEFAVAGYRVAKDRSELMEAPAGNLFGVFAPVALPYAVDRANAPDLAAAVPSLPEMAKIAIDRLIGGPGGFSLVIHGGRIDHAARANDVAALVSEQVEFDETLRMAADFALRDGETLLIATADHATANPGMVAGDGLRSIAGMKASYETFLGAAPQNLWTYDEKVRARQIGSDWTRVVPTFRELLGIELNADEASSIVRALRTKSPGEAIQADVAEVSRALRGHTGVEWCGTETTADMVPLSALGPGAEAFEGLLASPGLFEKLAPLLGLKA